MFHMYERIREMKVQIRWMIRRDFAEILAIERNSFAWPWTEDDFLSSMRQRNCIGMVAESDHRVRGYMVYELHKGKLRILNFTVDPECRRQFVATQMVQRLKNKLTHQRRRQLIVEVRETNLSFQLFLRSRGFKAVGVSRNHYDDTTEDAYLMAHYLQENFSAPFVKFKRYAEYLEYLAAPQAA